MSESKSESIQGATIRVLLGSLLLLFCGLVLREGPPIALDEYRLAFYSEKITAQAFDAHEIFPDCDSENNCWGGWFVEYEFVLENHSKVYGGNSHLGTAMPERFSTENLPQPIEIEYYAENPSINRAFDPNGRSISRVVASDAFALLLALSVIVGGFYLVVSGFRCIWLFPLNPLATIFRTIGKVVSGILYVVGFVSLLAGACYGSATLIRWLFQIPDDKLTGLPGVMLAPLLPLFLYLNVKAIELFEKRSQRKAD